MWWLFCYISFVLYCFLFNKFCVKYSYVYLFFISHNLILFRSLNQKLIPMKTVCRKKCAKLSFINIFIWFINIIIQGKSIFWYLGHRINTYIVFETAWFCIFVPNFKFTCDALRDLIRLVQILKCEKHLWWSVTFSKVVGWSLRLY